MSKYRTIRILQETDPHIPVPQQLLVAFGILLLVFGTTYINQIVAFVAPPATDTEPASQQPVTEIKAEQPDPFEDLNISARSAYVWDVREQRALFNKNADAQLPLASVTKLMTALVAYELMESDSVVTIDIDAIQQDGDSGLNDGDHFLLRDITDFTLITSSNDGAYALAAATGGLLARGGGPATFVDAMNIRAEELGLSQTYFQNPTGLDLSESEAGAYGSARDVAFLMEHIITKYPNIVALTRANERFIENENGGSLIAENTNQTVSDIPHLIASKTGYTALAGGNLVIAFNAGLNRPIIISVLGSTYTDRFHDTALLAQQVQTYIDIQN